MSCHLGRWRWSKRIEHHQSERLTTQPKYCVTHTTHTYIHTQVAWNRVQFNFHQQIYFMTCWHFGTNKCKCNVLCLFLWMCEQNMVCQRALKREHQVQKINSAHCTVVHTHRDFCARKYDWENHISWNVRLFWSCFSAQISLCVRYSRTGSLHKANKMHCMHPFVHFGYITVSTCIWRFVSNAVNWIRKLVGQIYVFIKFEY